MFKLTQLTGFTPGRAGSGTTPAPVFISDISDQGIVASAQTPAIVITGIDAAITLRLSLSVPMSLKRFINVIRDGAFVSQHTSGFSFDITIFNGQTLQFQFNNAQELSSWSGTATLRNISDGDALLASFNYSLTDTGSGGDLT